MPDIELKYYYTEIGYCQVHYTIIHPEGYTLYYCLMKDGAEVNLYRCSKDGEADYKVKFAPGAKVTLQTPPDEYGKKLLEMFLKKEIA